jgi:hypothetical protein
VALKYAAALKACSDQPCPPRKYKPRVATGVFRFVRNTATPECFEPFAENMYLGCPCIHYAISFWSTLEVAQEKYSSLAKVNDDDGETARKRFGDHIGEIDLDANDGSMTEPNKNGHISLHPEKGAALETRVKKYVRCDYFKTRTARRTNA